MLGSAEHIHSLWSEESLWATLPIDIRLLAAERSRPIYARTLEGPHLASTA